MRDMETKREGNRPITSMHAVRGQRNPGANIWIFESPKNKTRLTIVGEIPFMHLVLLEGRPEVLHYAFRDDPFKLSPIGDRDERQGYVEVTYKNGEIQWWVFEAPDGTTPAKKDKNGSRTALAATAANRGAAVISLSERELLNKALLFDNWATLCANITRARGMSAHMEDRVLRTSFAQTPRQRVKDLLALPGIDPALMLSSIARALQDGFLSTELMRKYFCLNSILTRGTP